MPSPWTSPTWLLETTSLFSVSMSFFFFFFKVPQISEIMQNLSFSV